MKSTQSHSNSRASTYYTYRILIVVAVVVALSTLSWQVLTTQLLSCDTIGAPVSDLPARVTPVESSSPIVDHDCLLRINTVLTTEEQSKGLDVVICNSNSNSAASLLSSSKSNLPSQSPLSLVDLVIEDRTKIRRLERRVYLKDLRAYRLSGNICNNDQDTTIPHITSDGAFNCLPTDYKRRVCMDGLTTHPHMCSQWDKSTTKTKHDTANYIPEPDRLVTSSNSITSTNQNNNNCEASVTSVSEGILQCHEFPMGLTKLGSAISPGQLAANVSEAKVLTTGTGTTVGKPIWRKEALDLHLSMIAKGQDVSPIDYPGAHQAIQKALDFINERKSGDGGGGSGAVKDKSVAIFGSISPWVESIMHSNGVKSPTMTVDYNRPTSYDARLQTEQMNSMLEDVDTHFDMAVSYSSIEHDGQGRYGDPLDPDGDFASMKEIYLKVKPGGYLLLHVPLSSEDRFYWYSMRNYGPARLPVLLRGWDYSGLVTADSGSSSSSRRSVYGPHDDFVISEVMSSSPVFILHKPVLVQNKDADADTDADADVLNTMTTSNNNLHLSCDLETKKCSSTV